MPSAIFKRNLESINVELSDKQLEQLDKYYEILVEWNSFMNLTGITEYEEVMLKHYLDSLVLKLPIDGGNLNIKLIDVGTGAGFPGIPIAITTERKTLLADSVGKKITALNRMITKLSLEGIVSTFQGRIEDLAKDQPENFSVITARALSSLSSLLELASPLLKMNGHLICYKSQDIDDELMHAKTVCNKFGMKFIEVQNFTLSDGVTHRSIVVFEKTSKPSISLPRRVGMAQKKPF